MAGRIDAEYQQLKDRTHRWVVERLDEEGIEVGNASRDQLADFIRTAVGQHIALNRVPLSTQDLNQLVRDTARKFADSRLINFAVKGFWDGIAHKTVGIGVNGLLFLTLFTNL